MWTYSVCWRELERVLRGDGQWDPLQPYTDSYYSSGQSDPRDKQGHGWNTCLEYFKLLVSFLRVYIRLHQPFYIALYITLLHLYISLGSCISLCTNLLIIT